MTPLFTHFYLSGQLQRVFVLHLTTLFLLFSHAAKGQEIFYDDSSADSTTIGIDTMPPLAPFIADDFVEPYYNYLWIFSDGTFINGTRDSVIKHVFEVPTGGGQGFAKLLATGLYSDDIGDPPPRAIPGDTVEVKDRAVAPLPKAVVEDENMLNVQRNHLSIVPGDTTAWIISYRHNLVEFQNQPISGYIVLFFNGPIRLEELDERGGRKEYELPAGSGEQRETSNYVQILSPSFDAGRPRFSPEIPDGISLKDYYTNQRIFTFDSLNYQEERHLILEIANDSTLLEKIPEKTKGIVNYMAIITSEDPDIVGVTNTPEKQEILNKTNVAQILEIGPSGDFPMGNRILDVWETGSTLSRAHDPNALTAWGCTCPPNTEGENQLVCRIDFMNEGGAPTSDIYLTFYIPPGLNPESIPDLPLEVNPTPATEKLLEERVKIIERSDDKIVWHLEGFRVESTLEKGIGHPSTTGHLTFRVLTDPGVKAEDLPAMRASIVFDDASPVYTLPVEPILVSYENNTASGEFLQCDACAVIPDYSGTDSGGGFPWWVIFLILLILLILILWLFLRNRNN